MSFETPQALAIELVQHTDNERELHDRYIMPIIRQLTVRKSKGTYDSTKAAKAFMHLAEAGARHYAKEYGNGESQWSEFFPIDIRRLAANHWRDSFEAEYKLGNYSHLAPRARKPRSFKKTARRKYTWTKSGTQEERSILARDLLIGTTRTEDPNLWEDLKVVGSMLRRGASVNAILATAEASLPPDAVLLLKTRTQPR